jgi:archaellum biogenesis ATPase FlaH
MIDEKTLRQWWHVFKNGSELVEIRILGKFQYSGYYKNIDKLIEDIKPYEDMPEEQIYFTLNDIDDGCYGRAQCEKILKSPKTTTSDNNITHRSWVLIDYDPVRVVGTNSTEEEFELAHKKAQQVFRYLRSVGFSDPVICKSGNGWHTIYKCDMPNTEEVRDMLSRFLQSVALMFTDEKVDIDEAVFNAARICKLYGTTAKKGANLPERPWRMSEIVYVPQEIKVNDISLFQKVANLLPKEEPKPTSPYQYRGGGSNEPFDLEPFLNEHGVQYKKETTAKWTKYVLERCFFNPEHKGKDAAIVQMQSGAIKYVCYHNSCQHHTWQEVRQLLDPNAYAQRQQTYQQSYQSQQRRVVAQQPIQQPSVKPETPELGKKWFSLKDIAKVNISELEHFNSGFKELDKSTHGLFYSSLTIVSGSSSSGKSTWLNSLILNAINQGQKCALWSGELRPDVLKTWIQMVAAGKDFLRQSANGKYWFVPNDIAAKIDNWTDDKFFLYNNEYSNKWEQIFADMKELLVQGVRIFILDNLFSLDIDVFDGDSNKKQKELINQLTDFKKKNKAHIILVAHPRKTKDFMRMEDISGSSDIFNAADYIFLIHRVNANFRKRGADFFGQAYIQTFFNFSNVIEVAKDRMMGTQDLLVGMYYEAESRRFKNTNEEKLVYGWREQPKQTDMFADTNSDDPFGPPLTENEVPF